MSAACSRWSSRAGYKENASKTFIKSIIWISSSRVGRKPGCRCGRDASYLAPPADPYVQLSRIRLLPRVCDGKALIGPRMKDTRFWEPLVNQPGHASPVETRQLAASGEHPMPAFGDLGPECHERSTVRRYCVVIEVAAHDIPKPLPLYRDRLVHAPSHLLFDHPQLRPHAVPPGLPFDLKFALASLSADEGEAQEVEGLRLAKPAPLAAFRRKASELNEPCLLGVQCQRKLQ